MCRRRFDGGTFALRERKSARKARGAVHALCALTGYFDLIREQEWKAQERFKKTARESFDA